MTRSRDGRSRDSRGPVVRPYAVTSGRTKPSGAAIDIVAVVSAVRSASVTELDPGQESALGPEHFRVLEACRLPIAVADLAADLDLPIGVVRILVADLREPGLVNVRQPTLNGLADVAILKEVADALRKL
jgi:hypothetical protein